MPVVDEKSLRILGIVVAATRDANGNLIYLTAGQGGETSIGEVTQGTIPWVVSGPLTEAQLAALFGEIQEAPTQYTLLGRQAAIEAALVSTLSRKMVNGSGSELFTVTTPGEVTQAALSIGTDEVAGAAILDKTVNGTASGETVIHDPAAGASIRLWKIVYQLVGATPVTASIRYGEDNTDHFTTYLPVQGSLVSHTISPHYKALAADEVLYLNLSGAPGTGGLNVGIIYQEIAP